MGKAMMEMIVQSLIMKKTKMYKLKQSKIKSLM